MHTLTHSLITCGASEVSSNPTIHFSCAVDLGTGEPCKGRKLPCVSLSFMRRDAVTSTNDEFSPFDHSRSPACTGDSTRARRHDVYETCVHLCNYQIYTRIRGMGIHFHEYKTYPYVLFLLRSSGQYACVVDPEEEDGLFVDSQEEEGLFSSSMLAQ